MLQPQVRFSNFNQNISTTKFIFVNLKVALHTQSHICVVYMYYESIYLSNSQTHILALQALVQLAAAMAVSNQFRLYSWGHEAYLRYVVWLSLPLGKRNGCCLRKICPTRLQGTISICPPQSHNFMENSMDSPPQVYKNQ